MKKVIIFVYAIVLCAFVCVTGSSTSNASTVATIETSVANLNVPTGVYFNGSNFIKVESTWLRIVIQGEKNV